MKSVPKHWYICAGLAIPGALLFRFGPMLCPDSVRGIMAMKIIGITLALIGIAYFPFAAKARALSQKNKRENPS